jgi:hypothetical protein
VALVTSGTHRRDEGDVDVLGTIAIGSLIAGLVVTFTFAVVLHVWWAVALSAGSLAASAISAWTREWLGKRL